eukprot:scaffold134478_cov69-Phaeocystis_antarctica.AAC.1
MLARWCLAARCAFARQSFSAETVQRGQLPEQNLQKNPKDGGCLVIAPGACGTAQLSAGIWSSAA